MCDARESGSGLVDFKADDWLRLEAEYRRQGKDVLLPLDMMLRRDEYFAGAYPYFADALGRADGCRPSLGFTDSDVVQYMTADRHNNKLVKSGLLARMRQAVDDAVGIDPDHDIPF
uniref:Uncharacterized protein n=1 Tax=Tanacetum cinerariifolium TaxID=118510 RepID=A0A699UJC9_TANCI|nr:hypothetical protein [Tanacetum cinerariifolium]